MKVVGLGQCSLDYIASVGGFPREDTKKEAKSLLIQGGGPVATALVALTRLGADAAFIGRVSNDEAGAEIVDGLQKERVDTRAVRVRKGGQSQTAFIIVNIDGGTRTILWKRPTVAPLAASEVDTSIIKKADMLLVDGLMYAASIKAVKAARLWGVPVMLDAGSLREGMMELCSMSDYIVCSEEFSDAISKKPATTLKKLARASNAVAITVTLGPSGGITLADGKVFRHKAFKVDAVDTTGAGDVFHGGYIYGLLKGWDIEKTVKFASAFAALKCTRPGGRTGIPTLRGTLRFMNAKRRR